MENFLHVDGVQVANEVRNAMHDVRFDDSPGECLKFARMVVMAVGGLAAWPVPMGFDADQAFSWFLSRGYVLKADTPLQPGDLLFKSRYIDPPWGHVAVCVTPVYLGENAETHLGRMRGALGYRTPVQFGPFSGIVRCKK